MRGTFANVRLKNELAPGTEGSWTTLFPEQEVMSVFAAAEAYRQRNTPLIVLAGAEYGTGSSRDWAAKGPSLLGVQAVIAKGYERIHRSNLIGMGIVPLQFKPGQGADELGLSGQETFSIGEISSGQQEVEVVATNPQGEKTPFMADIRIDTPNEFLYYQNGGILQFVLRNLAVG